MRESVTGVIGATIVTLRASPGRHIVAMAMTAREVLDRGVTELAEVLAPAGFSYIGAADDDGGGEPSASGEFRRGDRRLELGVRRSLGLVRYHFGDQSLSHEDLVRGVRALDGIAAEAQYPDSRTILRPDFAHLRADLERFGDIFLHRRGARAFPGPEEVAGQTSEEERFRWARAVRLD